MPNSKGTSTPPKLLMVDDDDATRISFAGVLSRAGYQVFEAPDGVEALAVCEREQPSLVILDVDMPKANGWQVLANLRKRNWTKPVLMLTGLTEIDHKVKGLAWGADDYLGKPCDARELIARVNALLRRSELKTPAPSLLKFGETMVNLTERTARQNGRNLELTRTQFALLELFARNAGKLVTRRKILEEVLGYTGDSNTRAVDTQIWRLRQKLNDENREVQWIQTVTAGDGYRLVCDPVG